jgi:hypothetical protein
MGYDDKARRRFTLLDAMVLVAATAIGLAACKTILPDVRRTEQASAAATILLAAWSWATLVLSMQRPRPSLRRRMSWPGHAACIAASLATVMTGLAYLLHLAKFELTGNSLVRIGEAPLICSIAAAPAVLASWLTLALGRRWRREENWIGWLGRTLGIGWILVFLATWFLV